MGCYLLRQQWAFKVRIIKFNASVLYPYLWLFTDLKPYYCTLKSHCMHLLILLCAGTNASGTQGTELKVNVIHYLKVPTIYRRFAIMGAHSSSTQTFILNNKNNMPYLAIIMHDFHQILSIFGFSWKPMSLMYLQYFTFSTAYYSKLSYEYIMILNYWTFIILLFRDIQDNV